MFLFFFMNYECSIEIPPTEGSLKLTPFHLAEISSSIYSVKNSALEIPPNEGQLKLEVK